MLQGILLADDSAAVRRAVRAYLTARNLPVCGEAEDGVEAIERAKELKPYVILLDLAMPRLNGLEAALVLKKHMPTSERFYSPCTAKQSVEHSSRNSIGLTQ